MYKKASIPDYETAVLTDEYSPGFANFLNDAKRLYLLASRMKYSAKSSETCFKNRFIICVLT
jgi:hypothetical protein